MPRPNGLSDVVQTGRAKAGSVGHPHGGTAPGLLSGDMTQTASPSGLCAEWSVAAPPARMRQPLAACAQAVYPRVPCSDPVTDMTVCRGVRGRTHATRRTHPHAASRMLGVACAAVTAGHTCALVALPLDRRVRHAPVRRPRRAAGNPAPAPAQRSPRARGRGGSKALPRSCAAPRPPQPPPPPPPSASRPRLPRPATRRARQPTGGRPRAWAPPGACLAARRPGTRAPRAHSLAAAGSLRKSCAQRPRSRCTSSRATPNPRRCCRAPGRRQSLRHQGSTGPRAMRAQPAAPALRRPLAPGPHAALDGHGSMRRAPVLLGSHGVPDVCPSSCAARRALAGAPATVQVNMSPAAPRASTAPAASHAAPLPTRDPRRDADSGAAGMRLRGRPPPVGPGPPALTREQQRLPRAPAGTGKARCCSGWRAPPRCAAPTQSRPPRWAARSATSAASPAPRQAVCGRCSRCRSGRRLTREPDEPPHAAPRRAAWQRARRGERRARRRARRPGRRARGRVPGRACPARRARAARVCGSARAAARPPLPPAAAAPRAAEARAARPRTRAQRAVRNRAGGLLPQQGVLAGLRLSSGPGRF